jgi:hypothetical protein
MISGTLLLTWNKDYVEEKAMNHVCSQIIILSIS